MNRITKAALAGASLALVLSVAAACAARDVETKITVRDLPQAVQTAFKDAYPEAEVVSVGRETRDGAFFYRIECRDRQQRRSLLYSAGGELVENDQNLSLSDLPAPVRSAMDEQCPNGKLLVAQKSARGSDVTYLVRMSCGQDRVNFVIDASGKVLQVKRISGKRAAHG